MKVPECCIAPIAIPQCQLVDHIKEAVRYLFQQVKDFLYFVWCGHADFPKVKDRVQWIRTQQKWCLQKQLEAGVRTFEFDVEVSPGAGSYNDER